MSSTAEKREEHAEPAVEKRTYIAGRVGRLQIVEDEYPLTALKATSHQLFTRKTRDYVSVHVRGLSSYSFGPPVRGRVQEWTRGDERVVCRVADDAILEEVARWDALVAEAEARLATLRAERQAAMEAALPRLPVAPVGKVIDRTEKRR